MPAAHGLFVTNGLQFKNIHPLEQYGTHWVSIGKIPMLKVVQKNPQK